MFGSKRKMEILMLVIFFLSFRHKYFCTSFLPSSFLSVIHYPIYTLSGEVWPVRCVFPDYTQSKVRAWWANLVKDFIPNGVDGIWNDMNEPAIFKVILISLVSFLQIIWNNIWSKSYFLWILICFISNFFTHFFFLGSNKNNAWEQCS